MNRTARISSAILAVVALTLAACTDDTAETATASAEEAGGPPSDDAALTPPADDLTDPPDHFAAGNVGRVDFGDGLVFTATSATCGEAGAISYALDDGETEDSVVLVLTPRGEDFASRLLIHGDVVGDGVATVEGNFDGATFASGTFGEGTDFTFELLTDRCGPADPAFPAHGGADDEDDAGGPGPDDFPEHGGADDDQDLGTYGWVDFEGVLYEALERSCTTTPPEPDWPHASYLATFEIVAEDGTASFVLDMETENGEEYFLSFTRAGETSAEFTAYGQVDMLSEDREGWLIGSGEFDDGGKLGFNLDFSGPDC